MSLQDLARYLVKKYQPDYEFQIINATPVVETVHDQRAIQMNGDFYSYLSKFPSHDEFHLTVIHEIAHTFFDASEGHSERWAAKYRDLSRMEFLNYDDVEDDIRESMRGSKALDDT